VSARRRRTEILGGMFLRHRGRFAAGVVLLLATNALALSIPWLVKLAVDAVQRGDARGRVALIAGAIAAVALGQAAVRTLSRVAILGASRHIVYALRNRFFARLVTLPAPFFDKYRTGDLMSRAVNDLMLVRSFFGPGILNLANTVLSWTGAVALMAALDWRLTLWSLIPYPFVLVAMNRLSRRLYMESTRAQEQLALLSSRAQENLSGSAQVKAYDLAPLEIAEFGALAHELRARYLRLARVRGAVVPLMGSVGAIGTLVILAIGTRHVIAGSLSLGDFVAFNAYLASLAWPTIAMGWILNVFQRSLGAIDRIAEVLDTPGSPYPDRERPFAAPAEARRAGPATLAVAPRESPPTSGGAAPPAIEVRRLTFAYEGASVPSLADVSFDLPEGGVLGIVGPVGSGKTTLLRLLARLYPVPERAIRIGAAPLETMDEAVLRATVALVPQESFLFSMPLADNIALGRPSASRAEIEDAGRRAGLTADLDDLPRGYDTLVGERGYTLSGGQRQRVALARALLMRPPVLLLDDPFASIDSSTEEAILGELERLGGITRIVAGHRVSAVSGADEILVLDAGRIVERGRHEDLIAAGGLYTTLFQRQRAEREIEKA
jgi:ATP-binding cassette subfamily B protein